MSNGFSAEAKNVKIGGGQDQWWWDHEVRRVASSLSSQLNSVNVEPSLAFLSVFGKLHVLVTWSTLVSLFIYFESTLVNLNGKWTNVSIWILSRV